MFRYVTAALIPLFSLSTATYSPTEDCPILGPTFSSDFDLPNAKAIGDAKCQFPTEIESLFSTNVIHPQNTSFIVDVYYTATNESISTATVMLQELYTVYAILVKAGFEVFNHPVTKYLPELAGNSREDPLDKIFWEDITVGALASHMGGDGGPFSDTPTCALTIQRDCSTQELLAIMRDIKQPAATTYRTPLYSDSGFFVLGRVLERLTNSTYNEAIQTVLAKPLGLNSSTSFQPSDEGLNALAIPGPLSASSWGKDMQFVASSGGIYSSSADLRALGLSILHSQLLSPVATHRWMNPSGHTAALTSSVGAPWEIQRLALPTSRNSSRTRISDVYTKLGGVAGYATVFGLSPDHGLGYSILIAQPGMGGTAARMPIQEAIGKTFIVAAEHAAADNAAKNFAGTFASAEGGANITLTVDRDHTGLGVKELYYNGSDSVYILAGRTTPVPATDLSVRLYPVGPVASSHGHNMSANTASMGFRAVSSIPADRSVVEGGKNLFDAGCQSWMSVDQFAVNEYSLDELVLDVVDGRVESVHHRSLGLVLKRVM